MQSTLAQPHIKSGGFRIPFFKLVELGGFAPPSYRFPIYQLYDNSIIYSSNKVFTERTIHNNTVKNKAISNNFSNISHPLNASILLYKSSLVPSFCIVISISLSFKPFSEEWAV